MLGLAQRHTRHDAKRQRLFGRRDDMLAPSSDDDRRAIEVRPSRKLQVVDKGCCCKPPTDLRRRCGRFVRQGGGHFVVTHFQCAPSRATPSFDSTRLDH